MEQVERRESVKGCYGTERGQLGPLNMEGLVRKITICCKTDSSFDSITLMPRREIEKVTRSSSQYYNIDSNMT